MYKLKNQNYINCLPEPFAKGYRTADGPTLKVAVYLMSGGECSPEQVAESLAIPVETVMRAFAYWQNKGLITEGGCEEEPPQEPSTGTAVEPEELKGHETVSGERACDVSLRDGNVSALLQETQSLIGRLLDSDESFALLELYDIENLPVDMILTAVAYCVPRCKNRRRIIQMSVRTAQSWCDDGVRDGSAAAEHVKLLELREKHEREVADVLSVPCEDMTKAQRKMIAKWYEELGYNAQFAKEALARSGKSDIRYINAMLTSWHKKGFRTLKDTYCESSTAPVVASPARGTGGSAFERALARRDAAMTATEEKQ